MKSPAKNWKVFGRDDGTGQSLIRTRLRPKSADQSFVSVCITSSWPCAFSLRVSQPIFYRAPAFPTQKNPQFPTRTTLARFRCLLSLATSSSFPSLTLAQRLREICPAQAAMAETLDMTLDDIIKNNKKSNPSSGGGRRSRGGSGSGGGGGGSGGVGPTRRSFKRSGNRQAPYQPPKVRTNRTG